MSKWNLLNKNEEEERFILSIDGGGIRGLVPAIILDHLDQKLAALGAKHSLYAYFDLIIGTSTGGVIALSLANNNIQVEKEEKEEYPIYKSVKKSFFTKELVELGVVKRGISINKIKDLYLNDGAKIFTPHNNIPLFKDVITNKYSTSSLRSYFYSLYKDEILSSALVPTAVVSFDLKTGKEVILSSYNDETNGYSLVDAARATSAAPTYFNIKKLDSMALIDGGVIANNPTLYAYKEAKKLYPNCKKFNILSLSTLSPDYTVDASYPIKGAVSWAKYILDIYQSSQSVLIKDISTSINDLELCRIDDSLFSSKIKMDDVKSVNTLLKAGETLAQTNEQKLELYANKLIKRKIFDHVKISSQQKNVFKNNQLLT